MLKLLKRKKPLLTVKINHEIVCSFQKNDIGSFKEFSIHITKPATFELIDQDTHYLHLLNWEIGWYHFSVYINEDLVCIPTCAITQFEQHHIDDWKKPSSFYIRGIRFQIFYISGSKFKNESLIGKGSYERGFQIPDRITSRNISFAAICDYCRKSFRLQYYHSIRSFCEYFYSDSGLYTLNMCDTYLIRYTSPANYTAEELEALEAKLPLAPDGSRYRFMNPLRCPHCREPYMVFNTPEERQAEYHAYYLMGAELQSYTPDAKDARKQTKQSALN